MTGKIAFAPSYGDGMVLQRGKPAFVRGYGPAGARVRVEFGGAARTARVDARGEWSVRLPAFAASAEPRELRASVIEGGSDASSVDAVIRDGSAVIRDGSAVIRDGSAVIRDGFAVIRDVVVGEVWFCSGQSNMEIGLSMVADGPAEAERADNPLIRLYLGPKAPSPVPAEDAGGAWKRCTRESVLEGGWGGFSAVAYYFGKRLVGELGIPVGLVQSAFGGAKIQPFIKPEYLRGNALLDEARAEWERGEAAWRAAGGPGSGAAHPFAGCTEYDSLKPATLWNGMVRPFRGMAFRGVIWYQGESNWDDGEAYVGMTRALLRSFRKTFESPRLPLYFVQIAPWKYGDDAKLFDFWEAQAAAARIPGTAMASTMDVGDLVDIHPLRKEPVGERLARIALRRTYGRKGVLDRGPRLRRITLAKDGARLEFDCAPGGLRTADGNPPAGFELAGPDGAFKPAAARIEGNSVVLTRDGGRPEHARHCRRLELVPTLTDASGIPAAPFGPYR